MFKNYLNKIANSSFLLYLITVLLLPLPYCYQEVIRPGPQAIMSCTIFHPVKYLFDPNFKPLYEKFPLILIRIDYFLLSYIFGVVAVLPMLLVFLLTKHSISKKNSIGINYLLWGAITVIFWVIYFIFLKNSLAYFYFHSWSVGSSVDINYCMFD